MAFIAPALVKAAIEGRLPRGEGQPPRTTFPKAETGPEKGHAVSTETEKAEISAKKARHMRTILRGLYVTANYRSGWWVRQGLNL